jgi:putative transposase
MGRLARVVAAGVGHHVTQRGNGKSYILRSDSDRAVYLGLLTEGLRQHRVSLVGYCLMSNHVHLVVVPDEEKSLALTLKQTHGRYAAYWNAAYGSSGHVWQGRFYSCPLDESHLWEAVRYTELNPVRARMVEQAVDWPWSSAAIHCGSDSGNDGGVVALELWSTRWNTSSWKEYMAAAESESQMKKIRQFTHTGRPLGSENFVREMEETMQRQLAPRKGGRPSMGDNGNQAAFSFEGE